jgi:hypothetical protein
LEATKKAILRISSAILPEIESSPLVNEFQQALDDFYGGKKLSARKINQSWELTTLILFPLMGYSSTFTYSPEYDVDRACHRELAYKILKGIDRRRACFNLVQFEEKVANLE